MRRIFYIPVLITLLLVIVVALTTTGTGLRVAAKIVLPMVPGQLSFARLDGRLIGPVNVTELKWQDDAGRLEVARLDFDWQPSRLPSAHLYMDSLSASGVRWSAPVGSPDSDPAGAFQLPSLPLEITVADFSVDDIRIENGPTVIQIDTLQLAGQFDDKKYILNELDLRSPVFDVSGAASLAVAAPNEVDTQLSWTARLADGVTPIVGNTRAHGDFSNLKLSADAGGPISLVLTGVASDLLSAPQLDGKLDIERFDPAVAGLEIQTGEISASLSYRVARDRFTLDGRILAPDLWPATVIVGTDATLKDDNVDLQRLSLKVADGPTAIDASGTLRTDLSELDLELGWSEFVWPPGDAARFASPQGTAQLTGSKDRYHLQLNGTTAEGEIPASRVSLRGQGTPNQFEIMEFAAQFAAGSLNGSGLLDWAASPQARLKIVSRDIELSQWHRQLEGRLGFDGTVVASLPPEGLQASVALHAVSGQLRGNSLSGSGAIDYAPGALEFRKLDVRAGQARIQADGRVAEELNLNWNLDVPDIGLFVPGGSGLLRSRGKASGLRSQPGLVGTLTLQQISAGGFAAADVDSRFDIGVNADSPIQISLNGSGITIGSVSIGMADGNVSGTLARHAIDVGIDGPVLKLETTLRGAIADGAWRGQIAKLIASRDDIGVWSLPEPSPLTIERERIALAQSCLVQRDARLCIGGELATSAPWRSDFELTALPLETFATLLPPGLIYEGHISGNGHVASSDSGWAGDLKLLLPDGRVISREDDEQDVLIAYQNGTVDTSFNPAGLQARMKLDLRDAGVFDANITVPTDSRQPLQGTVQARIENLSLVTALMPEIGRIDGRIDADLVLSGTPKSPDLTGQVDLKASETVLPDLGITLQDTVVAVVTRATDLRFNGSAKSGAGNVSLTGQLAWQDGRPRGQLELNGEQFRAINLPEIWLDMSPALTLTVEGREISLGGSVTVPSARITPIDISTGIAVSPDQVIVGQTAASEPSAAWQISGSVQVTAGEAVHINGYGLDGNLTGNVLIVEAPNQPTIGRGALEVVDGIYRAYGQELTIETGRLEFTGGQIDDPGLNLRAVRTAGDVTAGVQVRGALRRPVLTLYSVPAMSDTQAMSYLITGRGLEDLNEIDQTAVSDAATRLALRGGSLLASSLGRGLGLDSVEFEDSGAVASTSLVVGKHLSPRLFVSYGIGLFEAINTLRLRYHINSRLTLETQSGASTSADMLYSFER